jgi:hypothetical protein
VKTTSIPIRNLSALAGCWKGKGPNGLASKISYELGSDRTALLETMWIENNPTMYTVYYLVGEDAMAHHFCSYGNQLVMRATPSADPSLLAFKMIDSSNMPNEHVNHVFSITFHFHDKDHFEVEWGLHHDGRNLPQRYLFMRVAQGCMARPDEW